MTQEQSNFIQKLGPIIQKYCKEYGYNYPSAILCQAILESGWGKSSLAYKYNNYFGMKCGKSWKGGSVNLKTKEEYTVGTLTEIRDNFRTYPTLEDGIKGYFEFIQYSRYKNLHDATSAINYIELLKQDGYFTSSTYINSCAKLLEKYNLTQWDGETVPVIEVKDKTPVILAVKTLQAMLNWFGDYGLEVDGIIGPLTTGAYQDFRGK